MKIAQQNRLRSYQLALDDGSISFENEREMAEVQLGVPALLVSPVQAGGSAEEFRPQACIDVGFISINTPTDRAAFDTCTWEDEPSVVESFSPGNWRGDDWDVSGEARTVRSDEVHLVADPKRLFEIVRALGPDFWTDGNRNRPHRLPDSVMRCVDLLFAPDGDDQPARMKPHDATYKAVINQRAKVTPFPEIIMPAVRECPELNRRKGLLAPRASTQWGLLRQLIPTFGSETDGSDNALYGHPCLEAWLYEEWLGSARRAAIAATAEARGGRAVPVRRGFEAADAALSAFNALAAPASACDSGGAAPAEPSTSPVPPSAAEADDGLCDDVRSMDRLTRYFRDQQDEAESTRGSLSRSLGPMQPHTSAGQRQLSEFPAFTNAADRAVELERASLHAARDATRASAECDSVAVMVHGKRLCVEALGTSAQTADRERGSETCLAGFNPEHVFQSGRLAVPMGEIEFVDGTASLEPPSDAARRVALNAAGLHLPELLSVSAVIPVRFPGSNDVRRVAVFHLDQQDVVISKPSQASPRADRLVDLGYLTADEMIAIAVRPPDAALGHTGMEVLTGVLAQHFGLTDATVAAALASSASSSDGSEGQLPTPIRPRASSDEEASAQFTVDSADGSSSRQTHGSYDAGDESGSDSESEAGQSTADGRHRGTIGVSSLIWWARITRLVRLRPMFKAIACISGGAYRAAYARWRPVFARNTRWGRLMEVLCDAGDESWQRGGYSEREARSVTGLIGRQIREHMVDCQQSAAYAAALRQDDDDLADPGQSDRSQLKDRLRSRARGPAYARILYKEASDLVDSSLAEALDLGSSADSDSPDRAASLRHTVQRTIDQGADPTQWPTFVVIDPANVPGGEHATDRDRKYASNDSFLLTSQMTEQARSNPCIHTLAARLSETCADELEAAGGLYISSGGMCGRPYYSTTTGPHKNTVIGSLAELQNMHVHRSTDGIDATPLESQRRALAVAEPDNGDQAAKFTVHLSITASGTHDGEQSFLGQRRGTTGPYSSIECAEWQWHYRDVQRDDVKSCFSDWGRVDQGLLERAILRRLANRVGCDFEELCDRGATQLVKLADIPDPERQGQFLGARYLLDFDNYNPHTHPLPLSEYSGPEYVLERHALAAYAACATAVLQTGSTDSSQKWQTWTQSMRDLRTRPDEAPSPQEVWIQIADRLGRALDRHDAALSREATYARLEDRLGVVEPALRPAAKEAFMSYDLDHLCRALDDDDVFDSTVARVEAAAAQDSARSPPPPSAAAAARLSGRPAMQPGAFCASPRCDDDGCDGGDCVADHGAGVGVSTATARPRDATADISRRLLATISHRRAVGPDGSRDADPNDSIVVRLPVDEYLEDVVSSDCVKAIHEFRLVPVPGSWGTVPTAWTLGKVFVDYQLTDELECAENFFCAAGTYISYSTGDNNLLQIDKGHRSVSAFYAVPSHLAFSLHGTSGVGRDELIGLKCTAGGAPNHKGIGSGGGTSSAMDMSPALTEWSNAVGTSTRVLVEKSKTFTPVFQHGGGQAWKLEQIERRSLHKDGWLTSKTVVAAQERGEVLALNDNGQVDAKQVYKFFGLIDGGLDNRDGPAPAAAKAAVVTVFKSIGKFHSGGPRDFHRYWTYGVERGLKNQNMRELTAEVHAELLASLSDCIKKRYDTFCAVRELLDKESDVITHVREVEQAPGLVHFLDHIATSLGSDAVIPFNSDDVQLAELVFWLMDNYSSETPWFDQIERRVFAGRTRVAVWCPPKTKDIYTDYFELIEMPGTVQEQMETHKASDAELLDQALIGLPEELLRMLLHKKKDQWLRTATYEEAKGEITAIWKANRHKQYKWTPSAYQTGTGKQLTKEVSMYGTGAAEVMFSESSLGPAAGDDGAGVLVQNQSPGVCYSCGEPGHRRRECPAPETAAGSSKFECWNCGEEGHAARECPKPRTDANTVCHTCGQKGHRQKDCPTATAGKNGEVKATEAETASHYPAGVKAHPDIDLGGSHAVFGGGSFEAIGKLKRKEQLDFYNDKTDASKECSLCKTGTHNDLCCWTRIAKEYDMLNDPQIKGSKHRLYRLMQFTLHELRHHSHGRTSPHSRSQRQNIQAEYEDRVKKTKVALAARAAGGS